MKTKAGGPELLSRTLALFTDPVRLRLFLFLFGDEERDLCVSEIAAFLGSSLSNTSHQLRKLELAGIVEPVRRGRMVCYRARRTSRNLFWHKSLAGMMRGQSLPV